MKLDRVDHVRGGVADCLSLLVDCACTDPFVSGYQKALAVLSWNALKRWGLQEPYPTDEELRRHWRP